MQWSDELSVAIQEIDGRHQKPGEPINTLHAAMLAKQGKQVLEKTPDEHAAHMVYHFQAEEKYVQKSACPSYFSHKKEHDAFVKKVSDFPKEFRAGKLWLSLEIMNFLKDWVTNPIRGTDKRYSEIFHKNGHS
ncbi:MAG: bacteriohemerythrin [Methanoregulaceae archaeon]